jgi:hypothetical protein
MLELQACTITPSSRSLHFNNIPMILNLSKICHWTVILLFVLCWVAGMTGSITVPNHWFRWDVINFLLGWLWTMILLISASQNVFIHKDCHYLKKKIRASTNY